MMKTLIVTCPACRESLEIDPSTGRVVKHYPEVKPKPGGDFLKERVKSLQEEKAKREALVEGSREREKQRSARCDDLFRKVKDQAREEEPVERPLRDVDLD
jgi:hypothetical protein